MIEMDKVRKWPREHLEKRFHELDAHIDELESKVNDLELSLIHISEPTRH